MSKQSKLHQNICSVTVAFVNKTAQKGKGLLNVE